MPIRDLTKHEQKYMAAGHCPFCAQNGWYEGPSGASCMNIECANCGARFNVTEFIRTWGQLLEAPTKPYDKPPWWFRLWIRVMQ